MGKQIKTNEMGWLIHNCLENDITPFDYAEIYGDYTTEAELGNELSQRDIKRSDIQLV